MIFSVKDQDYMWEKGHYVGEDDKKEWVEGHYLDFDYKSDALRYLNEHHPYPKKTTENLTKAPFQIHLGYREKGAASA